MKKGSLYVLSSLAVLGLAGAGSQIVSAELINNNDGTQTIDNSTGTVVNSADVEIGGTIGIPDNTNPDTNIPDGDGRWINVTVPTKVIFWSEDGDNDPKNGNDNSKLTSGQYAVTNHSGRPVKVSVTKYETNNDLDGIDNLKLNWNGAETDIISGGQETGSLPGEVKLASPTLPAAGAVATAPTSLTFSLSGDTDLNAFTDILTDTAKSPKHNLELTFKALDKNGNEV